MTKPLSADCLSPDTANEHDRSSGWTEHTVKTASRPVIQELEPRILYSADLAPALIDFPPPAVVEQRVITPSGEFVG